MECNFNGLLMYILRWQTMKTTVSNGNTMEIQWKYNGNIMEHKCEQLYNVKVMDSRMKLLDLQWKNSNYNGWKEQFFSCEKFHWIVVLLIVFVFIFSYSNFCIQQWYTK